MHITAMNTESNLGCKCEIVALPLSQSDMQDRVRQFQKSSYTAMDRLEKLNTEQRAMVIKHTQKEASTLLFIEVFRQQKFLSVLGDLWITVLVWITQPGPRSAQIFGNTRRTDDRPGPSYLFGAAESPEDDEVIDGAFVIYVKTCM